MGEKYHVVDENGSTKLPLTGGVLLTAEGLNTDTYSNGVFVIALYDTNGDVATATGTGTVVPLMSPIEGQWQEPGVGDKSITATSIEAGLATYNIPQFTGPAIQGMITVDGTFVGVDYAEAYFWRN